MIYGYARVSTTDQNLDRQHDAFNNYPLKIDKVFDEKGSGKDFKNRAVYQRLKKHIKKGDMLVVLSIDRLGRNYNEILNEWRYLTEQKKCDICVIDMPVLNTKNTCDGLDGKFISNLVLQILAYVSQKERESIVERCKQGIKAAKERGVKIGRPSIKYDKETFNQIAKLFNEKKITSIQAIRGSGMSRGTFYRKYDIYLKEKEII